MSDAYAIRDGTALPMRLGRWAGCGVLAAALLAGTAHGQTLLSQTTWGGQQSDTAEGVAVATDGSAYMVALTDSFTFDAFGNPRPAIALVKFSANGSLVWQRAWTGETQRGGLGGPSVALSADQASVYVSGITNSNGGDAVLLKFDAAGNLLWQRTWGGAGREEAFAVATDAQGAVYISGEQDNFDSNPINLFVVKFSAAGALVWQNAWRDASAPALAVGADGNVYAAGSRARAGSVSQFDVLALKITNAGGLTWARTYSAGDVVDARGGMTVAADGGPIFAGALQTVTKRASTISALLVKLGTDGTLLFDREWGGKIGTEAGGVALAPDGSIQVAGSGALVNGRDEAFVFHVSADGRGLDAVTWGGATAFDNGSGVGVAGDGTVVLAATTTAGPPYALLDASSRVSAVRGTVAAAEAIPVAPGGVASDPGAAVIIPGGSTAYGGSFEAALVRFTR